MVMRQDISTTTRIDGSCARCKQPMGAEAKVVTVETVGVDTVPDTKTQAVFTRVDEGDQSYVLHPDCWMSVRGRIINNSDLYDDPGVSRRPLYERR